MLSVVKWNVNCSPNCKLWLLLVIFSRNYQWNSKWKHFDMVLKLCFNLSQIYESEMYKFISLKLRVGEMICRILCMQIGSCAKIFLQNIGITLQFFGCLTLTCYSNGMCNYHNTTFLVCIILSVQLYRQIMYSQSHPQLLFSTDRVNSSL